jgi:hypothetical protein
VVPVSYHDFFGGCATIAGALIGLLFVAISVSPGRSAGGKASLDHQVTAGAAFSALVNTLVIALVALLPGASLGQTATVLAAIGLSSTIGLVVVLFREHQAPIRIDQIVLLVALLALYGLELADGIALGRSPRDLGHVNSLGVLSIAFFGFAIARAWQLVGARSSHLLPTVAGLARRPASPAAVPAGPGEAAAGPGAGSPDPGPADPGPAPPDGDQAGISGPSGAGPG